MRDFLKRHGGEEKKRFTAAEMEAFNAHGWRCHYCGADGPLTADHVIPRAYGGGDEASNLVPACRTCNTSRGKRDYHEFKENVAADLICFGVSGMAVW